MVHIETLGDKVWNQAQVEKYSKLIGMNLGEYIYKITFGEEVIHMVGEKEYTLLPIGNINKIIQKRIRKETPHARGSDSISGVEQIIREKLQPITIKGANIAYIRDSYIKHYQKVLGESWSEKDFDDRLDSLRYRTYKYAVDNETGATFVVGFFGAQIATGAGGKYLTNAELYVLPEFRGEGIATELVGQSLELALEDGIEGFDSLTYRVQGYNPLKFWEDIGAECTELYHIAGDIRNMSEKIKLKQQESQIGVATRHI